MKKIRFAVAAVVLAVVATACTSEEAKEAGENASKETKALANGLERQLDSQPVPVHPFSQERETLRLIMSARATGATSTTMFQNMMGETVIWCPSLGAPIPSTYQLTAQNQYVDLPGHGQERLELSQMEPTGVYPGDSLSTWVLCLDDAGDPFAVTWENPVASVLATLDPASFGDPPRIQPDDITYTFEDIPDSIDDASTPPAEDESDDE